MAAIGFGGLGTALKMPKHIVASGVPTCSERPWSEYESASRHRTPWQDDVFLMPEAKEPSPGTRRSLERVLERSVVVSETSR